MDLKEFHNWRSRSAVFIGKMSPRPEITAGNITEEILECVSEILNGTNRQQAKEDAIEIVSGAIGLQDSFRKSKSVFALSFGPLGMPPKYYGVDFHPQYMSQTSELPQVRLGKQESAAEIVDLLISPCLIKHGNSDGKNYEQHVILMKREVLCNIDRFKHVN